MVSFSSSQRLALTSAALLVVVGLVVAAGVIPPVKADPSPGAMPQKAVPAFWVNAGLNFLTAAALGLLAIRTRQRSPRTTIVLGVLAVVVILLAIALFDAASAFGGHGPAMRTATILLVFCSAIEALAAVLIIAAAIRLPKHA